jgi:pimeloyl-ACP methyl ester carboxylesterase
MRPRLTRKSHAGFALFIVACLLRVEPAMADTRVFEKSGVTVEALVDGQGPLVVMIASLGRPAEDFDDLARRVAGAGYRAVRLQPRGVGKSSGPMQGQTLLDLAGDVALAIEALGGPAVAIGHAFGQRVARVLAASRPELVRGVVMLAAGGRVAIPAKARTALLACFDSKLTPEQHLENVGYAFFAPGNDPSVWVDGWNSETARMQNAAAQGTALLTWWEGGRAPMLVVQGLQDRIALPENGQSLKNEFAARVTLVEIDGAGHALLPEQPEAIATAVLAFIGRL